ncbi:UPF0182 family protein [Mastigocoleus sp. MO_188.B34]|uniref:UPF0182 family membrane protein n=1 Tax=Mastigocoleus sp. MO_188.B34 TaxID=3036635 RepID=UPI0026208EE5|nr:UPF0182 family protein [Mastigocoleus sp. MO_188.B34]MDJ0697968.1 UPF0182 family protein [Mastigocoleus sp. MO_188.B34]
MKFSGRIIVIIIIALMILLTSLGTVVRLITDAWWFDATGFSNVFWTRITWQVLIWLTTLLVYGLFLWLNYRLAMGFTRRQSFELRSNTVWAPYTRAIPYLVGVGIILIALVAATTSLSEWETVLKFLNQTKFGRSDPIFGQDISFYLFQLPFYQTLWGWVQGLLFWALGIAVIIYVFKGAITLRQGREPLLTGKIRAHLSTLLAAIAILVAINFWLQRYELLYSTNGVVFGAGYTDTHAQLHAYWFMGFAALVLAGLFTIGIWRNGFVLPLYGIGLYVIALIVVNGAYPWFVQQFIVAPNELEKERPYIANNIKLTQQAYDLDRVIKQQFPATSQLSREDIAQNQSTIRNIRLWDYRPLLSTYRQIQEIRLYYRFLNVDIDRYTINGSYRQVMLSPRELQTERLSSKAQTWVNKRLKYTHGYGLVMSPVNVVTPQGLPQMFIQNIPPQSLIDLNVTEPAIYYGEGTDNYIFTHTTTKEFDYPQGDTNAFTMYEGKGGVPLSSLWRRLVYAYDFGSIKILISNYFTNDSRVHYRRQIRARISEVAPFLLLDSDPYITVINGRLKWIVDAYTVSNHYPYSEPVVRSNNGNALSPVGSLAEIFQNKVNYIRNSVKVVVDAFDGTMRFFVVDQTDPILATYRKIFPSLFIANKSIPPAINSHFRYPLDLFKVQAQVYLSYHMKNPEVFYNREDLWRFPMELYENNPQIMEPYHIIMRLPDSKQEEFVLILPFTPVNKDNMIAWMAARSDGHNYGNLLLYEFPKQQLVYGPNQIEARINQNPLISQQLTLWNQQGSRVIRGDLLVIPIEQSLLYVEPVYLRAEQAQLPELKRVIVAYGDQVVMQETLEQSLAAIFAVAPAPDKPVAVETPVTLLVCQEIIEG